MFILDVVVRNVLLHHQSTAFEHEGQNTVSRVFILCTSKQVKALKSDNFVHCNIALCCFKPSTCPDSPHLWLSNFNSLNDSFVAKSRISDFLTGQQGEIRTVPGERVQGENKPLLHVWRPREENPRVQAADPQLPAHHRHVQPCVKSLLFNN